MQTTGLRVKVFVLFGDGVRLIYIFLITWGEDYIGTSNFECGLFLHVAVQCLPIRISKKNIISD